MNTKTITRAKIVTLRPKGNKEEDRETIEKPPSKHLEEAETFPFPAHPGEIVDEPEMLELARMIEKGELDTERTIHFLRGSSKTQTGLNEFIAKERIMTIQSKQGKAGIKQMNIRLPEATHRKLKAQAALDGCSMTQALEALINAYLSNEITLPVAVEHGGAGGGGKNAGGGGHTY